MPPRTSTGRPYPLGATVTPDGINFAVFSRNGTRVFPELFAAAADAAPSASLELDPRRQRTGDVWHVFVHGLADGQLYGWRVDGPYAPAEQGHRFNVNKLLSDPYARAFAGRYATAHDALYGYDRASPAGDLSFSTADSAPHTVKSVAVGPTPFDWEESRPPGIPLARTVIYEAHVRGLTIHPSSAVRAPGTFLGVAEKVPQLRELGVTAVELLPVHEFDPTERAGSKPGTGRELHNYWGYSTLGFFAPHRRYAADGAVVDEFREMVKRLHQAGIEVILDVVFNHTGERDETGPTLSFRGLDNAVYYMLDGGRRYRNYSGCGNTLKCNHPVVKQLILDCLRYWAVEMHVDGFRFDLATILGRDRRGEWIGDLGLLYDIGGDPVLRGCKLIAEAWDAEGMYKVGGFSEVWAEWNGRFRDDVRRFVRGDRGFAADLARRIGGGRDIFGGKQSPSHSINFVTAHDGLPLRDLVSYARKHNEANGEDNRDGAPDDFSSNHGVEGPAGGPRIEALRRQQAKNLLVVLLLSRGTPMLLGGDELWRTQRGNNNAYCHDDETSWIDWSGSAAALEMQRFTRLLVQLRAQHPALRRQVFVDPFHPTPNGAGTPDILWHGVRVGSPDWAPWSHSVALQIRGAAPAAEPESADRELYAALNAWTEPLDFELPAPPAGAWHRVVDTSLPSPGDIVEERVAAPVSRSTYCVAPRSAIVLVAR